MYCLSLVNRFVNRENAIFNMLESRSKYPAQIFNDSPYRIEVDIANQLQQIRIFLTKKLICLSRLPRSSGRWYWG